MTRAHNLLLATDAIFDLRQYVTQLGERHPAIRREMADLENKLLRVEDLIGAEADGKPALHGLMNEIRGLLVVT